MKQCCSKAIEMLDRHYEAFYSIADFARETRHPVPTDTSGWSQILVSLLTGINGLDRKKGADLIDGSDVKGANTWEAIDRPRFNNVVKAGTKAATSGTMASLDSQPYLFLVLWDKNLNNDSRCRIWCVRTQFDVEFRRISNLWYEKRRTGEIKSTNFQLHQPVNQEGNLMKNKCGNLHFPLLFSAIRSEFGNYKLLDYNSESLENSACTC